STEGITFKTVPTIFYAATINDTTGTIYLKIVNTTAKKETVKINLNGVMKLAAEATLVVVKGNRPDETNTITEPEKIVPVTSTIKGIKPSFTRTLDPYSVNILELKRQ
ncbi:MAG TPA: alpha-L-arabinofuranosidase C-terminal domain-containing protein, partial [Parafilimonas sp.]|nr:alpha-L-arabinofuranosidase C-terminal domain-containing protein [Parafilimonas sp.]